MKKSVIVFSVVSILALSVFVSAFSLHDLFKPTGNAVANWQITDPSGICMGVSSSPTGSAGFVPSKDCISYSSESSCDSSSGCGWNPNFYDYGGNAINIAEGWNLVWDFYYPGQISSGTISPSDVKAIYSLDQLTKGYYEMFPNYDSTKEKQVISSYSNAGYVGIGGIMSWVYFDKAGSFKFRIPMSDTTIQPYSFGSTLPTSHLIKGWNFVGISPAMFFTPSSGLSSDTGFNIPEGSYFTLDDIKGNCNITSAHFFEGGPGGGWTNVSLSDPINNSRLMKAIAINVTHDCILGQTDGNIICESDGAINYKVKGTVSLIDSANEQVIQSQSDSCQTYQQLSQWSSSAQSWSGSSLALVKKYCGFDSNGNVEIMNYTVYPGPNCPNGCFNGACKESASCTSNADCSAWGGSTAVCVSGQCYDTGAVPSPSCTTDADCSGTSYNSYCVNSHCEGTGFIGCIKDTDCSGTQVCVNGRCEGTGVLPNPTVCTSNADCSSSQICSGGVCYGTGANVCLNNADCYNLGYLTAVCVSGQCMGTGALVCNSTQTLCGTICCNSNQVCAGGYCYGTGGLSKCATDADCSSGQVCSGGQCYSTGAILPSPVCKSNSDCSIGYCAVTPMSVFAQCVNNVTSVTCNSGQTLCGTNACCNSGQYCVVDHSSGVGVGQCEGTGAVCSSGKPYCGTQCCTGTQVCATMSDGSKTCMGTGVLCPSGQPYCGSVCCSSGQTCVNNACV